MPKEREEQERAELQGSWEMAAVLDFLNLFRRELGLGNSFTWGELESALILSPGDQGVLCWLHIVRPCAPLLTVPRLLMYLLSSSGLGALVFLHPGQTPLIAMHAWPCRRC